MIISCKLLFPWSSNPHYDSLIHNAGLTNPVEYEEKWGNTLTDKCLVLNFSREITIFGLVKNIFPDSSFIVDKRSLERNSIVILGFR